MIKLSKRLQAVADLVTEGSRVCDVGTDHGYIPIYLVGIHKIPSALAMDVNEGPLLRAKEHIAAQNMTDAVSTRRSDGLKALQTDEADSVVIAGMGGGLIIRILEEGAKKLSSIRELILQPQSDIALVREYIRTHGFTIVAQDMVYEDGKYYMMFRCVHADMCKDRLSDGQENMAEKLALYDRYGRQLIEAEHPVLVDFLKKEETQLLRIQGSLEKAEKTDAILSRQNEVAEKLRMIELAREEMLAACSVEK